MCVDVIKFGTGATRLGECATCGANRARATRRWQGDVQCVGGGAVAHEFGERRCAAGQCYVESLQQQDARTFGHHESIAAAIERSRRGGRIATGGRCTAAREGTHVVESRDHHRVERRLGAASECDGRVAAANHFVRLTNRVTGGGAGAHRAERRALRANVNRHFARGHVANGGGDQEGRDATGAALGEDGGLFKQGGRATQARADDRGDTF